MPTTKLAEIGAAAPLDDAGILLHVLNNLGPGLFISAVSKAWRDSYVKVASVQMAGLNQYYEQQADLYDICSHTTCSQLSSQLQPWSTWPAPVVSLLTAGSCRELLAGLLTSLRCALHTSLG
jgi:hypothetical protein